MRKKSGRFKYFFLTFLLIICAVATIFIWDYIFKSNTKLEGKNFIYLKIPKNTDYETLKKIITSSGCVKDFKTFDWYAKKLGLEKKINPGRYRITSGLSNRQIVKMIKNGNDEKVEITINYKTRTKQHLIENLKQKINIDESKLTEFLENDQVLEELFGLDKNTITLLVRPGKYQVSWATDHLDFFNLMKKEFDTFWDARKFRLLKRINLTKEEAMIMASIIEWESKIESEQRKIAGVYFNRLAKNIQLQADPTVIFALNNFNIRRVSYQDLKFDSPYNTYKHRGLPPGPIGFPSDKAINSVLNYERSDYLYFCAKPELNGYSNFSSNLSQHEAFAKAYRESLNKRGIRR